MPKNEKPSPVYCQAIDHVKTGAIAKEYRDRHRVGLVELSRMLKNGKGKPLHYSHISMMETGDRWWTEASFKEYIAGVDKIFKEATGHS